MSIKPIISVSSALVPNGTYPAVVGGHTSKFQVNGVSWTLSCLHGVRGQNIQDTVTVTDGVAKSKTIGLGVLSKT